MTDKITILQGNENTFTNVYTIHSNTDRQAQSRRDRKDI